MKQKGVYPFDYMNTDFNTQKRTQAKNSFEKDFFKLMNNSVFGKTIGNLRKREVKLVTDEKKLMELASRPTFMTGKFFNANLVAVHTIKETLTLNRPAYVGMCMLDLSETLMYYFHYNYIKKKYDDKAKLLFTDTDSLTSTTKSKLKIHIKIFGVILMNSIIVNIQKTPHISINQTKN